MGMPYREYELPALHLQYAEAEPDVNLTPKQALDRDGALVRRSLWTMPLQSAHELTISTGLSLDRIYRILKNLGRHGLVTRASLGRIRRVQKRFWLTTQGVLRTAEELGRPIPWQVTETGLRWLIRRLPAVESFYSIAPQLFGRPDVLTPRQVHLTPDPDEPPTNFTDDLKMVEFEWIRDGEIHAVAHYANRSWIPLIWIGSLVSRTVIERKAEKARQQLQDAFRPAGWVIVCDDDLAAKQAADAWNDVNALVLNTNGYVFRQMRPSTFSLKSLQEKTSPKDLGAPEAIVEWLREDGTMLALNGRSAYKMFRFIAEFAGSTPRQLATVWDEGYRAILRALRRAKLVVRLGGGLYLDRAGILAAAHMDRISWQSVDSRVGVYLKPDGVYRRNQAKHNRAVIDVAATMFRKDADAFGGWRAVYDIPGVTQVIADVVILLGDEVATWEEGFIEVEFTARTRSQIEHKLEPYRLVLQHTGNGLPCWFLVGDAQIRQRYADLGADLIQVMTLEEFLSGEWD